MSPARFIVPIGDLLDRLTQDCCAAWLGEELVEQWLLARERDIIGVAREQDAACGRALVGDGVEQGRAVDARHPHVQAALNLARSAAAS